MTHADQAKHLDGDVTHFRNRYRRGTYLVQTNPSVQTVQTLIWATRSTKGVRRGVGGGDL